MSDEEDERIKFEVTDYDLESEFEVNRHRKLTKNQIIYGVFADDENEDDRETRRSHSTFKKKKDYNLPVNFISGGVQQAGKEKEKEKDDSDSNTEVISDSSEDEIKIRTPFSMSTKNQHTTEDIAGLRKRPNFLSDTVLSQKGVGNWEKHTKGIGAKLLMQMGFQPGKGLGKDLQGIQAPIEAHLRKGRGAIGAYGPEKKSKIGKLQQKESDVEETTDVGVKRISHWKKQVPDAQARKINYVYKSVDDIIEQSKKPGRKREISELSKVKVIDMTGPEQRVLSGYHAIAGVQKPAEEWEMRKEKKFDNFSLPEIQHNLNLLVDLTEQTIIENDQKLKHDEDKIVLLENRLKNMTHSFSNEKRLMDNLTKVLDVIDSIMARMKENNLTLEESATIFSDLRDSYFNEFFAHEIPFLAEDIIRPIIEIQLEEWKPLEEPSKVIPIYTQWKSILKPDNIPNTAPVADAYGKLIWDTWFPCVRNAADVWQCRKWGPMVEFITHWLPHLTSWIVDAVLETIILERLQKEVNDWDPMTDCVPIHSWIYPWINFLGKHFDRSIYPMIRQKLSIALNSWHPSDSSARLMLQPWVSVFSHGEMDAFIANNIIPKLQIALQDFVINPHRQHLDNWNWVMEWSEMISPLSMAVLLDKCFFPKWIKVLNMWLSMNPNYDEVRRWYCGWKTIIPEPLLGQPLIKDHLRAALESMSSSVGGSAMPNVVDAEQASKKRAQENLAEAIRTASKIPEGFKDLVQKRCEERGLLWMPISHKYMEGKQIYRCGRHQVYIDRNVLFVSQDGGAFVPMSIQELMDIAG